MATFSFELYPPRSGVSEAALRDSLNHLAAAGPEFTSVTYGANGSSRESSLGVLRALQAVGIPPMAHLTCVGSSYAEATGVIRGFLDAGITSFLALRGDPPAGSTDSEQFLGDLRTAGELVQLIQHVQREREPFAEVEVPGFPRARRIRSGAPVTIAVAAFPNGHPRSRSLSQDLDTLLAKEAAGANLAITQLFFYADDYLAFVDRARAAGVTLRILPGIMPAMSSQRLARIVELTGETAPAALSRALDAAEGAEAQRAIGIAHAVGLASELLAGGADGIHLYTFNSHEGPLAVLRGAGLLDDSAPSPLTASDFSDTLLIDAKDAP